MNWAFDLAQLYLLHLTYHSIEHNSYNVLKRPLDNILTKSLQNTNAA